MLSLAPQKTGVHVISRSDVESFASAAHPNVVMLPSPFFSKLHKYADGDMQAAVAALHFTLAHEMAHLYLRHTVRPAGVRLHSWQLLSCHGLFATWWMSQVTKNLCPDSLFPAG